LSFSLEFENRKEEFSESSIDDQYSRVRANRDPIVRFIRIKNYLDHSEGLISFVRSSFFPYKNTITGYKYAINSSFVNVCKISLTHTILHEVTVRIVATRPRVAPVIRRLRQTAPLTSSATGYSMHSCSQPP